MDINHLKFLAYQPVFDMQVRHFQRFVVSLGFFTHVCVFFNFFYFFVLLIQWSGVIFHKKMNRICWLHARATGKRYNLTFDKRHIEKKEDIIHDLYMCCSLH